jgi:hypothetical protein
MFTQEKLKEYLHYCPKTGMFTWVKPTGKRVKCGDVAGRIAINGYWQTKINYVSYLNHRLAWFYTFGVWPKEQLDHINCDRADNRLCNLREATRSQNIRNSGLRKDSVSGIKGVRYTGTKWMARIRYNGKLRCLGQFDTAEEAAARYKAFAEAIHKEFLHNSLK